MSFRVVLRNDDDVRYDDPAFDYIITEAGVLIVNRFATPEGVRGRVSHRVSAFTPTYWLRVDQL